MGELILLLVSWLLAGLVVRSSMSMGQMCSVGLPLAYFVGLFLIHVPGAAIYLVEGHFYRDPEIVLNGFRLTTYGLWAFVVGVIMVQFFSSQRRLAFFKKAKSGMTISLKNLEQMAILFFATGLVTQLVIIPLIGPVATLTSLLAGLASLSVVGVCLGIWRALLIRNKKHFTIWLLLAFTFPFITLTHNAFLGYGVHKLVVVIAFVVGLIRIRPKQIVLLLLLTYLGLSFFVTYIQERTVLRDLVWQQGAGYSERIGQIENMFLGFELFNTGDESHLNAIDLRLNQNYLVGLAIENHEIGGKELANGKTLWFSVVALIPRVLWPGKPDVGGGGNVVADYTGLTFSRGTSVGAGQVFEFYVNFGVIGVIFGFLVFGFVIKLVDQKAALSLASGDYRSFIMWFLPGIGFLQAGGNMVEITTSVGAAIGSALVAIAFAQRYLHNRSNRRQQQLVH